MISAALPALGMPASAHAQGPWVVSLTPTMNPLPIGSCGAVRLEVKDPRGQDAPRNPKGMRVALADFDLAVTAGDGRSVVGAYNGPNNWSVCACQAAAPGTAARITATYPANSLPADSRVPAVAFTASAEFTLSAARGTFNPPGCEAPGSTTVVTAQPAGPAPPPTAPPASGFAARQLPDGSVEFTWRPASNAAYYIITGPGTPPEGIRVTGTRHVIRGIAPGNRAWRLGVFVADATLAVTPPPTPAAAPPAQVAVAAAPAASAPPPAATPASTPPVAAVPASSPPINGAPASGGARARSGTPVGISSGPPVASAGIAPTVPVPINPAGFTSTQIGPGEVRLSWTVVREASYYVLLGPGLTHGGTRVSNGFAQLAGVSAVAASAGTLIREVSDVPAGTHEWAVASYYEHASGLLSTPAAEFSRTTLTVTGPPASAPVASAPTAATPVSSGRYLVTITGLRAFQASKDDFLSRDGKGDEVYVAAYVRRYDRRTGQLAEFTSRRTMPHGDVAFFGGERIQAGTMSPVGGIWDGDPIPDGPLVAMRTLPPQDLTFPFRLWEGTLTDGADALVINPTIWEQDGNNVLYAQWEQQQHTLNLTQFTKAGIQNQIAQNAFGTLVSGASGVNGGSGVNFGLRIAGDIGLAAFGMPIVNLLQTSSDRPIGMVAHVSAPDQTSLLNHTVVLTREIIEAALARPPLGVIPAPPPMNWELGGNLAQTLAGRPGLAAIGTAAPKPGVIVIQFHDGQMPGALMPDRPAVYHMFVQVERVP